jgi:hypothetical protein
MKDDIRPACENHIVKKDGYAFYHVKMNLDTILENCNIWSCPVCNKTTQTALIFSNWRDWLQFQEELQKA